MPAVVQIGGSRQHRRDMRSIAQTDLDDSLVSMQIEQIERRPDHRLIRPLQHFADRYADSAGWTAELRKKNRLVEVRNEIDWRHG